MATISTDANYSDVTYSNNEAFTIDQGAKFTIDQSTIDLRNMRCLTFGECLVKNTSTTTPMIVSLGSTGGTARWQFTAGGISTVEGEWIVLGTGNGTAGQTFNIPQAQGVNGVGTQDVPVIQGLFIDDNDTLRDGSSIPQLCLEVDSASYTNATDHERGGNVFTFDSVAQTVTFKRAVPVGKDVLMPNIIFYTSSNFTGATEFDLLVSQTGTFNWDKCLWSGKFDFTLTSGKKITLKNCAFNTDLVNKTFGLNSQVEPPLLENVIIKGDCSTVALLSLSNSASAGSFKNLWVDCSHTGEGNPINSQNSSSFYIEKLVTTNYLGGTSVSGGNNSRAAITVTSGNSTFYDIYNFIPQQTIYLGSNASNCKIDNVNFQFGSREDATGQTNCGVIRLANCNGNVVTNIEQIKAGPIYPYGNALLCAAGTANNTIANVVLRSGASGSGNNRWNYAANDSGFQNRYNNFVMHGYYKTAFYNNNSASLEAFVSNFYAVDQQNEHNVDLRVGARCRIEQLYLNNTQNSGNGNFDQQATASGVDSLSVMGIRNTADGGAIEKTDGLFYLRMSPTEEQTDYFTAVTQTGVIVFNNNNILYIENSGDVVELESFVHYNVSSISSDLTKQGSTVSSFDVTVKMRRPAGTYTSYVATTQSAMQAAYATLASDAENRVQFKFRIEKNTTNLTDYLQGLRFDVTLTGDDYPFVLTPATVKTTVVDSTFTPIQDARVYLKETSGGAVVLNALTDSSGIAQTTVAYTADKAIDGWVRKSTAPATIYKQFTLAGTLTSNGLELTAIMTEDV
jgi:hypothetical protein